MIMMKPGRLLASAAVAGLLAFAATPASATTISFDTWTSTPDDTVLVDPIFTVDDNGGAGFGFDVNISLSVTSTLGNLSAIYFDIGDGTPAYSASNISDLEDAVGGTIIITSSGNDTNNVGTGGNVSPIAVFDFGFAFDQNAPPVSFTLADLGFLIGDWTRVGLRFQSVCSDSDCNDSDKLWSATVVNPPETPEIPLPAALPIFLITLGGAALFARRRRPA